MLFITPLLLAVVTSMTSEASVSMWLCGVAFAFWGALSSAVQPSIMLGAEIAGTFDSGLLVRRGSRIYAGTQ
jgi:hypothetical protein